MQSATFALFLFYLGLSAFLATFCRVFLLAEASPLLLLVLFLAI
jgi:hypothetical protein